MNLRVGDSLQAPPGRRPGRDGGQALLGAAAMLLEVPRDQRLNRASIVGVQIAPGHKMLGQWPLFLESPGLKGRDELRLVDQPILQSEQTEKETAICFDGSHEVGLPKARRGPRRLDSDKGVLTPGHELDR